MIINRTLSVFLLIPLLAGILSAQPTKRDDGGAGLPSADVGVLGGGDEITLRDSDVEELNGKVFQIGEDGTIGLPIIGRLQVAGLTVAEFERAINDSLKVYVKEPRTTVASVQYRSRPVSVLGAVTNPGVYQMTTPRTLVQMLSVAGGLRSDAGSWLVITRKDPRETSHPTQPGADFVTGVTEIRIPITGILNGSDHRAGMLVVPNDVISVAKAEMIFVMGDVKKPGGFVLGDREQLSLIRALSLAEGLQGTASARHAKVLRDSAAGRSEIPVDIAKILDGKGPDLMLLPDDVLYVPTNTGKKIALRSIEAAIQTGTGIVIWRR
jgi:polysaccharide export outer membrane protein